MKDRWILPKPLWASSGKLVGWCIYITYLNFLQAIFPNTVQFVQFPYVIDVNCLIYTTCTSLLYSCFAFCFKFVLYTLFQTNFYILHVNSHIHINKTDYHARDLHSCQYVSGCSDIHMNILIFDEDCSPYHIPLHIICNNITLIIL